MAKPKVQIIQPSMDLRKRAVNFKTGFGVILTPDEAVKLEAVVEKSSDTFAKQVAAKLKVVRESLAALNDWVKARHADGFLKGRRAYWFESRDWADRVAQS